MAGSTFPAKVSNSCPADGKSEAQHVKKSSSTLPIPSATESSAVPESLKGKGSAVSGAKASAYRATSRDTEPSDTDSSGNSDIEPGPYLAELNAKSKAESQATWAKAFGMSNSTESSNAASKRKGSSFEGSDELPKKSKRRETPKKNASSSRKSTQKQPAKVIVESDSEVVTVGSQFLKILAKGWQTPLGISTPRWCYLVEWEEDEATNTKAGDTTWEPVNTIKKDQKKMVEAFETRMLEESRKGPPTWKDVPKDLMAKEAKEDVKVEKKANKKK